jgi:hypothetical protein
MKGLNLSHFKKMKEDKHSATLIHKDGHQFLIAKAPLTHLQKKQLENLEMHYAEGGDVPEIPMGENTPEMNERDQLGMPHADNSVQGPYEVQTETPARSPAGEEEEIKEEIRIQPPRQAQELKAQEPGLKMQQNAERQKAKALANQGEAEVDAIQHYQDNLEMTPTSGEVFSMYQDSDNKLRQAYADKELDPNKYWDKHSKVLAGIGIGVSALGQILGADGNGAIEVIQEGIHHELERQKNSQDRTLNLWKMNRQMMGSDIAANLQTQNQLLLSAEYEIKKAAAAAKGPIAKAEANNSIGKLQQQIDANNAKLTLMNPTSDDPDPATRVNLFIQNEATRRAVADEIDKAKAVVKSAPRIYEAFELAAKDARPTVGGRSGTSLKAFIPGIETAGQKAIKVALGPTFSDREGTINQDALNKFAARVTPNIGDSDHEVQEKLKSIDDYLKANGRGSLSKANGIDLEKFPLTNTSQIGAHPEFGGNSFYRNIGESKSAPKSSSGIQTINGVQYRKVMKDGKAIMQKVK